jgi:transposase
MVMLPPLEEFIPSDHRLRRLSRVLDLSFVHEVVRDYYCQNNGRPSIDPEVMIRLFLLQAIEGIGRVRELMRQVQVNMAYRWFIGYELDERLPDHSTLSRTLDRLGEAVFDQLFKRSIGQCLKSGLVSGKVLHVDATTIRADLDANKVKREKSPDADARFGRFSDGKLRPGYKQHTVCDDGSRVVLGVSVTAANEADHDQTLSLVDEVLQRLEKPPKAVCGDAAYASGRNYDELDERGVLLVSPPPQAKTYTGEGYFSVEKFKYDQRRDLFVCPGGKKLKYLRTEKGRGRREYRALRSDCRDCALKAQCTSGRRRYLKVSANHAGLVKLRADSKRSSFKKLYASRAPNIEGVFAEAKQWHSLGRAWRRGLSKMRVQCLLTMAVLNFKRLMAVCCSLLAPFSRLKTALIAVCDLITEIRLQTKKPMRPYLRPISSTL